MQFRVSTLKATEFKLGLGFRQYDIVLSKEQSVIMAITKSFPGVKMIQQCSLLNYKIDLYLPNHRLTIEIDEKNHVDRDEEKEEKREKEIKQSLNFVFIRINSDSKKFTTHSEFGKFYSHINEINKKITEESTKTSFINNLSKGLLEMEFTKK